MINCIVCKNLGQDSWVVITLDYKTLERTLWGSNPGQGKSFFIFFWLAHRECLFTLFKQVHHWGLGNVAKPPVISFHRENEKYWWIFTLQCYHLYAQDWRRKNKFLTNLYLQVHLITAKTDFTLPAVDQAVSPPQTAAGPRSHIGSNNYNDIIKFWAAGTA